MNGIYKFLILPSFSRDRDSNWKRFAVDKPLKEKTLSKNVLKCCFSFCFIFKKLKPGSGRALYEREPLKNKVSCTNQLDNVIGLSLLCLKEKKSPFLLPFATDANAL